MRFLVDENLPADLVEAAQSKGIEAVWVRNVLPAAKDRVILERLLTLGEVLVTRDIGFANLILSQMVAGQALAGAILIREERVGAIRKAWQNYLEVKPPTKSLVVLTSKSIRVRRLKESDE